ncbi:hypothetical protein IWQ60_010793 [Tieghemiomyces parasiticus]|uniref:SMP-30/Gluconolactonase/LRE-like region domain-containing protein n=1 Tax=Tieghemiomyces parasiticus TaxID=78921 RepID=A0A9W8DMB1_9FUNG|nr:hypothetical protein IWQ60_010793 [Tieghemiomyces parasiticus]
MATWTLVVSAIAGLIGLLTAFVNFGTIFFNYRHGVKPFNTDGCVQLNVPGGCEDIVIHAPSHTAFLACGRLDLRTQWFPPLERLIKLTAESDAVYKYHLKSGELVPLTFVNFTGIYRSHGLTIYEHPASEAGTVTVMLVNHGHPDHSSVEIFDHRLDSNTLIHVRTITDPLIRTPNAVVALSPRSFFLTNDFYHRLPGPMRTLEKMTSRAWTDVVVYQPAVEGREALHSSEVRRAYGGLVYANGIDIDHDRGLVFVASATGRRVTVFDMDPDTLELTLRMVLKDLPILPDNLRVDHATGDIYAAGIMRPIEVVTPAHGDHFHPDAKIAWGVVRLSANSISDNRVQGVAKHMPIGDVNRAANATLLLAHPGPWLNLASVAVLDPDNHRVMVGSVVSEGVGLCPI